jgi:hypothetical protein
MTEEKKYFLINYAAVPQQPSYSVWDSSWSAARPTIEPSTDSTMVLGVTSAELPEGAILVGISSKDPPVPPPPPPDLTGDYQALAGYQRSIADWLATAGRKLSGI